MILRPLYSIGIALVVASGITHSGRAQDVNSLKSGVVRIHNSQTDDVGTGFILKIEGTQIYIVTAAHVVSGDRHPKIYLFNQPRDSIEAEVINQEDEGTKGLAVLQATIDSRLVSGIRALNLTGTSRLNGGEGVRIIGFPDSVEFWTVGSGTVARVEGKNIVFSGSIRGGYSGAPVLLQGSVLGVVTDVSQSDAYAVRSEAVELYVNGIIRNLSTNSNSSGSPSDEYSYQIIGSINNQPIKSIDTKEHRIFIPFQGKLRTFDLTVKQLTNGSYCDVGVIKFPSWSFPPRSSNDGTGIPRVYFSGGVQNAKNSPYLELLVNPGTRCR